MNHVGNSIATASETPQIDVGFLAVRRTGPMCISFSHFILERQWFGCTLGHRFLWLDRKPIFAVEQEKAALITRQLAAL